MAKLHPAHVGLAGSSAQTPAIRRRLGERAKSIRSGRSLQSIQDRQSEGRKRARSPASSAWRRVFVLANTAFNWLRAVSRLTPSEDAAPSIPTPEASFAASFASAAVKPNAAQNCVASGRSRDLRSVNRRITRPELNKSLPNAVTGIASTRSQGASSRSTTIDAWG